MFALVFVLVLMFKIMFMIMFVMMLTRAIVHRNLRCTKVGKCCLMVIFNANTICKTLGLLCCGGVCVCGVWCVSVSVSVSVSVCKLCVITMCVCGSCVCARVWWYVFSFGSGCLSVCLCLVWLCCHLFMVCVSVVVCHNIVLCCGTQQQTHHEHHHHTAHENRRKPLDSHFQNEADILGGSKVKIHARFFFTVQSKRERQRE